MKRQHIFETEVWLPRPREEVFEFISKTENLQRLAPPWRDFEILTYNLNNFS